MKIKFAIATNDSYQCVLEAFLKAGWQLETLFVSPDNWMHSNRMVTARALELGATVKSSAITLRDLAELGQIGCTTLVVASYKWKIPDWRPYLEHAVNFHPSPLPEGRGPYPQVRAILENRTSWAVTCHQINEEFDQGDILDAENFQIDPDECHETLQLKVLMAATRLAERVATGFDSLWTVARPQGPGSYWPRWSDAERKIDFTQPVWNIMRQVRAFGDLECMATINGVSIFIHRANGWTEPHLARPGTLVHSSELAMVVAAANGFIAITEWSFTAPGAIASKLRC
ncbi:MAG: formyltransferase family protein [Gallionella sp.]